METIYRKVAVEERMPIEPDYYITDRGDVAFSKSLEAFISSSGEELTVEWWLQEIPDFVSETIENSIQMLSQLQKDKEELIEGLKSVIPALRYFDSKREEIESLIQKHNP